MENSLTGRNSLSSAMRSIDSFRRDSKSKKKLIESLIGSASSQLSKPDLVHKLSELKTQQAAESAVGIEHFCALSWQVNLFLSRSILFKSI